ncbi:hypothetical protein KFZ56_00610 [Virgibacillus sp. NKC19-3]|uniref:hypothetical protein n=1 Tax=Virgibacillus saliphilus TaxID=2831674 RepID=UPI001C9A9F00|nr:hypothetical protein [Virgibacillus sp. NKC19-3]MBY7141630.1 hypothetical protein [Virgibacillus sp. NKC19-3]
MRKNLLFLFTVLFFIFFGSQNVSADPAVEAEQKVNAINLTWNLEGETYKIYRDGEIIWEGNGNSYLDENLESSTYYDYKIGSFSESGDLLDLVTVTTSTIKPKALKSTSNGDYNSEVYNAIMTSNVGKDYIELDWTELETNNGLYKVYRDGEKIAEVSNTYYKDDTVAAGKSYNYKIAAERETSNEKKEKIEKEIEERNLSVSKEEMKELTTERESLIRTVRTPDDISLDELKGISTPFSTDIDLNSIDYTFLFRYTTFIPDPVVENPHPIDGGWLEGDNRTFSATSNDYRTRSDVYAGWSPAAGSGGELRQEKDVGESVLYEDEAGTEVIQRDTASDSGITLTPTTSNTLMYWVVNHDVGVPFGIEYPNINYQYTGRMDNNYSGELNGGHDKAPNHEINIGVAYTDSYGWAEAYSFTGESFFNLVPGTPQETFNYTF